ncbi:metal ABC transporter solute-binding protein, Zn/Mn family [Actinophytocola sediminis]
MGGLALTAGLVITLTGCGAGSGDDAAGSDGKIDGKIAVVASTNVWGSVAALVGGDAVSVESLVNDAAGDPHAHPDRPSDAAALADADVVLYNGGGYDEFFSKLVDTTGVDVPQVNAFELSGHGEEEGHEEAGAEEEHGHEHGAVNEHVWYDLPTVHKVADALAEEFTAIAPDQRATFTANAEAIATDLDTLLAKAADIGKANPGAQVIATEPVATYLLEAAGLTDATPPEFSEAIEEETDPPLSVVAQTTDLIASGDVSVLINNAQTETAVTNSIKDAATQAGIPVVNVTETLPEGVTDYVEWMTTEVDALAGALNES